MLGMSPDETQGWLAFEAAQPDGGPFARERELRSWPLDLQEDAEKAARATLERLPLSVRAHLENRGLVYHSHVFPVLVRYGMRLQEIDDEIAAIFKQDPADPRLPALYRKRRGGRVVLKVG